MPRADMAGLWWNDTPPPKVVKVKEKRVPPTPTWLDPGYLPHLQEARNFEVALFEDYELVIAAAKGERLVFDIECYENYFLIAFMSTVSGKIIYFERTATTDFDTRKLTWILGAFCLISFNGIAYDIPILRMALAGATTSEMKDATTDIISFQLRPADVLRKFKQYRIPPLGCNHIDLIEVAPLFASLKIYAGRLHCARMQDLPFHPNTILSKDQITITRWYCCNDLSNTDLLYKSLAEEISIRETMSMQYGLDLRSKSDAQIAEAVITHEIEKRTGKRIKRPVVEPGRIYRYKAPRFLQFQTPILRSLLEHVKATPFEVSEDGNIGMPPALKDLKIPIGDAIYRMGIGGLHSSEKTTAHFADSDHYLIDRDVTSYYPQIILLLRLIPEHLGEVFLSVYREIVDRRITAKRSAQKLLADMLKIVVNGSFGKLGSPYSALYAPNLLIQVTVTGQLALLMLIEWLELAGITVVSANTDGIVSKCPKHLLAVMNDIVSRWEKLTGFETEETQYMSVFSRDVNNYLAVKKDYDKVAKIWLDKPKDCKAKGAYAKPERAAERLHKNPTNEVCLDAVQALLIHGAPVADTIRNCTDPRKFVTVRTVANGAVKDGEYLGKAIRWYYAQGEAGEIISAKSGNKVPRSEGARPMLVLPQTLPSDIDFDWYVTEANRMLRHIGYSAAA